MEPAGTNSEKDRRIARRLDLALRVDFKLLPEREVEGILEGEGYPDLTASAMSMSKPRKGMIGTSTADISLSGVGLRCYEAVKKGSAAAIDLHLPGERTVVKLLGEVIWSGEVNGEPRAGLRFAALDFDSAERVKNFLDRKSA